jgi:hypothetical protein
MPNVRRATRVRLSGTIEWMCPNCHTINVTRSFRSHLHIARCKSDSCDLRMRIVFRQRVGAHADADPPNAFPLVPVERVEWHVDDAELAHSR